MAVFRAADIIELALELEKNGEAYYRSVADKARNARVKELFEDLAYQETLHYKTFEKLGQTAWDKPLMSPEQWQEYLDYLQATVQSAFFEGQDKALAAADKAVTEQQALQMAIEFEKETLLFFHDLRDLVPAGEKATVLQIIAEEKAHLRRLADMLRASQ